jgi:toxic protein SymE
VEEKSSNKQKRQLKIYSKYLFRTGNDIIVPEIRLCGKWLREYGFHRGQTVIINCEEEKITITVKKKE